MWGVSMAIRNSKAVSFFIFVLSVLILMVFCVKGYAADKETSTSVVAKEEVKPSLSNKEKYEQFKKTEHDNYYAYIIAALGSGKQLTPTQIKALNEIKREVEAAKFQTNPLKRVRQTIVYSEDKPPVVYIGRSQLSTISFVDRAGNPYPIQSFEVSDAQAFNVTQRAKGSVDMGSVSGSQSEQYTQFTQNKGNQENKQQDKSLPAYMLNSLTIRGQASFANGSVVVYLIGKANPVYLVLESNREKYNYQSDITVDGLTAQSLAQTSITGVTYDRPSNEIMMFLNGTPPKGALSFDISLSNSQVWKLGEYFYIRTKAELMSPAYITQAKTSTGFSVYKILATSNVINVSDHGRLVSASIHEPMHVLSDVEIQQKYGNNKKNKNNKNDKNNQGGKA
jgi:intracellular multiplication protein IcmK